MSEIALLIPIVAIAVGPIAWVANNWIRARHGYPLQDSEDGDVLKKRKVELLANENARLSGQISRLEERIAVLERIATDPAERLGREIERLHACTPHPSIDRILKEPMR